jgi:hypothetical protein
MQSGDYFELVTGLERAIGVDLDPNGNLIILDQCLQTPCGPTIETGDGAIYRCDTSGQLTLLTSGGFMDAPGRLLVIPTSATMTIEKILEFFDDSVADDSLKGDGRGNSANGRLNAFRNMLEMAGDLIDVGDIEGACGQLKAASRKCDGDSPPPDFVAGPAVSELHDMILGLMEELGCE